MINLAKTVGRLTVHMNAQSIGMDWNIIVYGGDRPHIGAVALASHPQNGASAPTCHVICLPGHREGELATKIALALYSHFKATVCVSCGIHLDGISHDEIILAQAIVEELIFDIQARF